MVARPWEPDDLPEGDEKVEAVRSMFDAIAPRYDLVNRVMTFRMDVGWRRRTVRDLRLGPGSLRRSTWPAAPATSAASSSRPGPRPLGSTSPSGCSPPTAAGAPRARPTSCACPLPDGSVDGVTCGFALRNLVELGAFFAELARVVRPGGRIALLEVATPPNPVLRWGHGIYFGKVVPLVGGLLSDPAAYRYLPKSVAYLPDRRRDARRACAAAGFADVRRTLLSGGISQLAAPARIRTRHDDAPMTTPARDRRRPEGGHPAARPDVDLVDVAPRRRLPLRAATASGLAGRGVALRIPVSDRGGARWLRHRARRRGRPAGQRAGRLRRAALPARAPPASWWCPRSWCGEAPTARAGSPPIDGAEAEPDPGAPPRARGRRPTRSAPGFDPGAFQAAVCRGPRRRAGRPPHQGRAGPRRRRRGRSPARRPRHPPAAAGHVRLQLPLFASTASSAPAPSCSWPATATSCARTRWPAPRPAPATPRPTPGWPRSSSPRPRTRSSTASPSTWCTTRCCPGARTSTGRPSRRS